MADEVTELRIRILSDGVAESKQRLDELTASGRKTETSVKSLGDSAEKNFKKFAVGLVSVAALGAGLAKVTREWVAYDKSMKEVSSIMSTSSDQFQKLRGDVLQLSVAMGVDATVAAKGLYQAVSAGIPQENAFAFMTVAAKAAIANVTDVETSVNVLTNVINAYKLPVSEATNISDKLFSAVLGGKTTMEELSQSMSKGTVPAAALGVSFDELLASVVAITLQGTPTAEAFTQVNATMTALKDPSKEMQSAIEGMGFASSRAAIASIGYGQVLQNLKNLVGDNDLAFNKLFGRIEASNGVISQTGANFALFSKALDSSLNSAGMSADAAAKNSDTLGVSLTRLSSSFTLVMENFENRFHTLKKVSELLNATAGALAGQSFAANALIEKQTTAALIPIQEKLNELLAKRARLQKEIAENPTGSIRKAATNSIIGDLLPENPEAKLAKTENGIKILTEAVSKFDAETKQAADHFLKLNAINSTNLPKETKAGLMGDMRALWAEETKNALEKKTLLEQDAAASKAADEEKRVRLVELAKLKEVETKERGKTLEEGIKLSVGEVEALDLQITKMQELQNLNPKDAGAIQKSINLLQEKKKVLLDTAAQEEAAMSGMLLPPPLSQKGQTEELKQQIQLHKDLDDQMARVGTTQTELLEKQKASFELEKKQFPQKAQAADKAIAAIDAEIQGVLDLDAKKSETAAKDQARKEKALADQLERFNLTPIFETPGNNEFEKLQIQEDAVRRSYEKRKADILEIVGATETEKAALLIRNEKQMTAASESIDKQRNQAKITATKQAFDDLASIGSAFGKTGFKIAQASAIASATITMIESAQAAYKNGVIAGGPYAGAVLGPTFAAVAIAAGAANIAKIKSQNYSAYAQGGMIPAGQTGLVGEAGPEFVRGPAIVTSAAATANQRRGKDGSDSKPMQVIINNLPGQSVDMQEREGPDLKTVEFTIAKLTAEAQNGGGKLWPVHSRAHGLKRKTN